MNQTYRPEVFWLESNLHLWDQNHLGSVQTIEGSTMLDGEGMEGIENVLLNDLPAIYVEVIGKTVGAWRLFLR
jgi:hypothetical protein